MLRKYDIHENSCRNWDKMRHSNFSSLRRYRTLQLLSGMHNLVLREPVMPALVGGILLCESFALYLVLTSMFVIPVPILVLSLGVAVEMSIIIGLFRMMANPFVKSEKLLKYLQILNGPRWVKRFVMSCPPSKMILGDGNFFDKATSLVIWRKSVDLLITFLLK